MNFTILLIVAIFPFITVSSSSLIFEIFSVHRRGNLAVPQKRLPTSSPLSSLPQPVRMRQGEESKRSRRIMQRARAKSRLDKQILSFLFFLNTFLMIIGCVVFSGDYRSLSTRREMTFTRCRVPLPIFVTRRT